ncbi:hypothetical protein CDD83_3708 [Cordyceps sp. RAO-2017]|nr:hypothetical protein CDD83_3708 [Cordyceps sp. RAO-2017]
MTLFIPAPAVACVGLLRPVLVSVFGQVTPLIDAVRLGEPFIKGHIKGHIKGQAAVGDGRSRARGRCLRRASDNVSPTDAPVAARPPGLCISAFPSTLPLLLLPSHVRDPVRFVLFPLTDAQPSQSNVRPTGSAAKLSADRAMANDVPRPATCVMRDCSARLVMSSVRSVRRPRPARHPGATGRASSQGFGSEPSLFVRLDCFWSWSMKAVSLPQPRPRTRISPRANAEKGARRARGREEERDEAKRPTTLATGHVRCRSSSIQLSSLGPGPFDLSSLGKPAVCRDSQGWRRRTANLLDSSQPYRTEPGQRRGHAPIVAAPVQHASSAQAGRGAADARAGLGDSRALPGRLSMTTSCWDGHDTIGSYQGSR